MDIRELLSALRAAWWLVLAGAIAGGALALGLSLLQTPLYSSSTQLFVSATNSTSTSDALQGSQFSQERVASYAELVAGEELARRVIERLDLDVTPAELRQGITAAAVADTVLIDVSVRDPSADRAQRIAGAVGDEFVALVEELETPASGGLPPVNLTVTDRPDLPAAPSSPQTERNVALGVIVGLLSGAGAAVARTRLDRSIKDGEEASRLTGAPLLGMILRDGGLGSRHLVDRGVENRTLEDYRQLRTNLQFVDVDQPPSVIMVSSSLPSEGKTTLTINLALALADTGRRVVILEADLRRPRVTEYMGLVEGVGLTNILAGTADLDEVTQVYREGVAVVAGGPRPPNPGELLGSGNMSFVVEKLRGRYDIVLIDAPPLLPVADASALAPATDGVLLTVRYGRTHKDQVKQTAETLHRVGAKTLGVVLNIVPAKAEVAAGHGYGY